MRTTVLTHRRSAGAELNRRICVDSSRSGVTIVDPASTWVDVDVSVGADYHLPRHLPAGYHHRWGELVEIGP